MIALRSSVGGLQEAGRGSAIWKTISLDESVQDASPAGEEKDFDSGIRGVDSYKNGNWAGRRVEETYHLPRGMEQPGSSRGS